MLGSIVLMLPYRRRGTVVARRLTAPRTWRTESGDVLQAEEGDWWVVDDGGRARSVRDADFRATHERVHGHVYRRTGVMRARRVRDPEKVQTQEGVATAHPGMWIVVNDKGEAWPVPDADFRSGYEPVSKGHAETGSGQGSSA